MGYRTFYNLNITEDDNLTPISAELSTEIMGKLLVEHSDAWYALDDDGNSRQDTTWDDVDKDMVALSIQYATLVFEISGTGDEATDIWSTYYKAGKLQHCPVKIIYPPYNPNKLRNLKTKTT